jgi:hypothetical protein
MHTVVLVMAKIAPDQESRQFSAKWQLNGSNRRPRCARCFPYGHAAAGFLGGYLQDGRTQGRVIDVSIAKEAAQRLDAESRLDKLAAAYLRLAQG